MDENWFLLLHTFLQIQVLNFLEFVVQNYQVLKMRIKLFHLNETIGKDGLNYENGERQTCSDQLEEMKFATYFGTIVQLKTLIYLKLISDVT
jgi:hypothetical protein